MVGKFLSGKLGIQVVDMLLRNLTVGNLRANSDKCKFRSEHRGILEKKKMRLKINIHN